MLDGWFFWLNCSTDQKLGETERNPFGEPLGSPCSEIFLFFPKLKQLRLGMITMAVAVQMLIDTLLKRQGPAEVAAPWTDLGVAREMMDMCIGRKPFETDYS